MSLPWERWITSISFIIDLVMRYSRTILSIYEDRKKVIMTMTNDDERDEEELMDDSIAAKLQRSVIHDLALLSQ